MSEKITLNSKTLEYENLVQLRTLDMNYAELYNYGIKEFALTPEFNLLVTLQGHDHLYKKYGVNPDTTLFEGYCVYEPNHHVQVNFKPKYQPTPGFSGSAEDLATLKEVVADKIKELFNKK